MQKRTDAVEQTKHIHDIKTHTAVQTDPTAKHKLVAPAATMGRDATGAPVGGNGMARAPQTGTSKGNSD